MTAQNEDFLFAQEAQDKGYVTEAQLEEAFLLQKRMADELKIEERIAVILVKRGWLAEEQARRVYALIEPEGNRTQIEGYRIVERLGRGAMGTVYKAIHLGLHRVVAIKVLRQELLGEKVHSDRLGAEAKMLAALDHPNIVAALDAGESNGFPYVVMEYVEGETLKERITRDGPLSEGEALRITRAISDALERARRMGVVHRDVKPGNILISKKGEPKLMDLGLARGPIDLELTQAGATVGTPQFMSPEQVEDAGKVDTRSDIYSLGATLYSMLTGKPPFTAKTMTEILTKVLNEEPVPVRVRNPDVSPEVGYLVQRMMLKDVSLRYQTPALVVEDIDNITGGHSIVPPGFAGNWEAWLLRQRIRKLTRIGVGVAVLLVVAIGGFITYDKAQDKKRAREGVKKLEAKIDATDPERSDTLVDAQRKLREATAIRDDILAVQAEGGVSDPISVHVKDRLAALDRYVARYRKYAGLEARALALAEERKYAEAYSLVEREVPEHRMAAIHDAWRSLKSDLLKRSDEDWLAEKRAAKAQSPGDLDAVVRLFGEYRKSLGRDYVVEGPRAAIKQERVEIAARDDEARAIHEKVRAFETRYSQPAVNESVRQNIVAPMRGAAERGAVELRNFVDAQWGGKGWSEAFERKPLATYVRDRIELVERRIDDAVEARWRDVRAQSDELVEANRMADAKAVVVAFRTGLGTFYRALDAEASAHVEALGVQLRARQQEAARIEHEAIVGVLADIRDGHVDGARQRIRKAIEASRTVEHEGRLEQLRLAVAAYERACDLALRYLAERVGKLEQTVEYDGQTVERWRPVEVNPSTGDIVAKAKGNAHRQARPPFRITKFGVGQIARWARAAGVEVSERDRLLIRLFELPSEPYDQVQNLLGQRAKFRALENDFAAQSGIDLWSDYVSQSAREIRDIQESREAKAAELRELALYYLNRLHFAAALRVLEELLNPARPWWNTQNAERFREDDREKLDDTRRILKEREIESWLPGVRAFEGEPETRIAVDFDVPEVLDVFAHGFGRLVKQRGPRQVTPDPDEAKRYELELLPYVPGVLPGRPLVLESPFDPGAPIQVEFDLRTQKGAFFLAIDVDGVKLGVLSADPAWYPQWRIPEALRREDGDGIQWYGRGRGVAVQSGPSFFDVSGPKWSWAARNHGDRYEKWEGKAEIPGDPDLFAFVPGRAYRVRLRRDVDSLVLSVADLDRFERLGLQDREKIFREVYRHREDAWARVGTAGGWRSEIQPNMRLGTGRIQILSWSTVTIDDLEMTGVVRAKWRDEMRSREERDR